MITPMANAIALVFSRNSRNPLSQGHPIWRVGSASFRIVTMVGGPVK